MTPPISSSQQYVQVQPGQIVTENLPNQAYIPSSTGTHVSAGPLPRSSPYAHTPQPEPSSSPRVIRKQLPAQPPSQQNTNPQSQRVYSPSPGGLFQMPSGQSTTPSQQQDMRVQSISQPIPKTQSHAHAHAPLYGSYPQPGPASFQQQPPRQLTQHPIYVQYAQNSQYNGPQAAQNQPIQANVQAANVAQFNHQTMQNQQPVVQNTVAAYQVSAQPMQAAFRPGIQSQHMSQQYLPVKCPVMCNHCKKGLYLRLYFVSSLTKSRHPVRNTLHLMHVLLHLSLHSLLSPASTWSSTP